MNVEHVKGVKVEGILDHWSVHAQSSGGRSKEMAAYMDSGSLPKDELMASVGDEIDYVMKAGKMVEWHRAQNTLWISVTIFFLTGLWWLCVPINKKLAVMLHS